MKKRKARPQVHECVQVFFECLLHLNVNGCERLRQGKKQTQT